MPMPDYAAANTIALYHLYFPRLPVPALTAVTMQRPGEITYAMPGLIRDMWRTTRNPINDWVSAGKPAFTKPDLALVLEDNADIIAVVNATTWARLIHVFPFVVFTADAEADVVAATDAEQARHGGVKLPGIFTMAKGLVTSVAEWVSAGIPMATKETVEARLEICKSCPDCDPDGFGPGLMRCKRCGCGGAKLNLETSRCPLNKW